MPEQTHDAGGGAVHPLQPMTKPTALDRALSLMFDAQLQYELAQDAYSAANDAYYDAESMTDKLEWDAIQRLVASGAPQPDGTMVKVTKTDAEKRADVLDPEYANHRAKMRTLGRLRGHAERVLSIWRRRLNTATSAVDALTGKANALGRMAIAGDSERPAAGTEG